MLQGCAHAQVQRHEVVPGEVLRVMQRVLPVHPAEVGALLVDAALQADGVEMQARAVAAVQMPSKRRAIHQLAASPALRAGKRRVHLANDASQLRVLSALPIS